MIFGSLDWFFSKRWWWSFFFFGKWMRHGRMPLVCKLMHDFWKSWYLKKRWWFFFKKIFYFYFLFFLKSSWFFSFLLKKNKKQNNFFSATQSNLSWLSNSSGEIGGGGWIFGPHLLVFFSFFLSLFLPHFFLFLHCHYSLSLPLAFSPLLHNFFSKKLLS